MDEGQAIHPYDGPQAMMEGSTTDMVEKANSLRDMIHAPSPLELSRQRIAKLQQELEDEMKLLALLQRNPDISEVLRLLGKRRY